ncbi:MAG TPA: potassium channel family protein [Acidimicrobiales bacterium]|nr:potassium channel family protein [Acidimicrobiales bacterium]
MPSTRLRVRRSLLGLVGVLVAYYVFPVDEVPSSWDVLRVTLGLIAGLAAVAYVVVRQLRMLSRFRVGDPGVRLDVLALAVFVVVPLFALGYYATEAVDPGQFRGLRTKTDALYFSVSTLVTVGFGDVHAGGQVARALVTVQMAFDVVVVAAAASVLTTQVRARAAGRHGAPPG